MRLNKYIAQSGVASRRKADALIENKNVKINGLTVQELGTIVKEGDIVEVNGKVISPATKKIYLMLNKPEGFVTTLNDDKDRPTVVQLLTDVHERVFPIGRLDYNTTGLLLLTNDGELANKLAHPKHKVYKTYRAVVQGVVSDERLSRLRKGVDIGDFVTSPAKVKIIKQLPSTAWLEIQIYEGKNRQIRKMFDAVGNKVLSLERVAIGEIYLSHLKQGHYRKLTRNEIEYLLSL